MKKVLALVLALAMAFSLAACGQPAEEPDRTEAPPKSAEPEVTEAPVETNIPEKPATPIKISVSVAQTGDGFTVLTDAAAAFNASQSDYVVDLYYGGSYTEIATIMMTSNPSDRPDIFASAGNDTAAYINMEDKMYIPCNDFIVAENYDVSNIVANLRANYQRNCEWQCFPLGNTNVGQYYNTEVLGSLGIDVKTLKSYQDIFEACKVVSAAGYKNFYYLRALSHIDWLNYAMTAQGIEYYDNANGRAGVPTKCLYDEGECNAAALAFFQFVRDMIDSGYLLDPTISADDARISFANQEALIMDGYSSGANAIVSLVKESAAPFQWSYEVSPVIEAGKPSKGQSPGGGALFIANTGDYWRQQGAWEFMKYLLNDDVVSAYAMATGYTPITETGSQTEEYKEYAANVFPSVSDIIAAQKATEEGVAYAPIPFSGDANTVYKDVCAAMLSDPGYTAEQAVADMTSRINEAIELYRLTNNLD